MYKTPKWEEHSCPKTHLLDYSSNRLENLGFTNTFPHIREDILQLNSCNTAVSNLYAPDPTQQPLLEHFQPPQ